ncbi:MAG: DUF2281 domain-containing protein [Saprospiraceae bacterium]|nr:DUF2281 domain-containing protein [Saprospiraceae bacterium]
MNDQVILRQLQQLPNSLKKEVLDFIGYLLSKYQKQPKAPKHSFSKYRGSLKSGLSRQDIDMQIKKMRDEWERPGF